MLEQQEITLHAQSHYNEVMLRAEHLTAHLPFVIEAVFYPRGREDARRRAAEVHKAFLNEYGLSERRVPLLQLDLAQLGAPFSSE